MLTQELPPASRLALAYAPARIRPMTRCVLVLDARLAQLVSSASETILAQMRLAWWRDNLRLPATDRPSGDPLLDAIGVEFADEGAALRLLVDGWEAMLVEPPLPSGKAFEFAEGRAAAWKAIAAQASESALDRIELCAMTWALDDLALGTSDDQERAMVQKLRADLGQPSARLPRSMRPLTILSGLARRALAQGEPAVLGSRASALVAMRLGIFGR